MATAGAAGAGPAFSLGYEPDTVANSATASMISEEAPAAEVVGPGHRRLLEVIHPDTRTQVIVKWVDSSYRRAGLSIYLKHSIEGSMPSLKLHPVDSPQ
jgi:hypothetical protein